MSITIIGGGTYETIQAAIDAAVEDDTIVISSGTYSGNVTVDVNGLTIIAEEGAVLEGTFRADNTGSNPATSIGAEESVCDYLFRTTAYSGASGAGITIQADGVTIQNLEVRGYYAGIELGNGTDGASLTDMTITETVVGIRKGSGAAVTDLTVTDGEITDSSFGLYIAKESAAGLDLDGLTISGTSFSDLTQKGIYVETLSDALITGITMTDVGELGRGPAFGGTLVNGNLGGFGGGIDINLKWDHDGEDTSYSNITIEDFTFTNVGVSNGGVEGAPSHFGGAAIGIKARDDAPSYSSPESASYTGSVIVQNGTIDGTSVGIRVGEPNKANSEANVTGPDVDVSGVEITNATVADANNVSKSTLTVEMADDDTTFVAQDGATSTGAIDVTGTDGNDSITTASGDDTIDGGAGDDTIDGGSGIDTAVYSGTVTVAAADGGWTVTAGDESTDTLSNVEIVNDGEAGQILLVGEGGFATIQEAVNAASAGDTILVAAGEYTGNVVIDKAVTLRGANAGLDGNDGERGAESVILGKIDVTSSAAVIIDGFEVRNTAETSGGGPSNPALWFATGGAGDGHLVTNTVFNSIVAGGASGVDDRAIGMGPIATGEVRIEDNLFTGTSEGKYGTASWGRGIWSDGGGVELSITGNEFQNTRTAINYDGPDGGSSANLTIEGNTFDVAGTAMSFAAGGEVTGIVDNTFNDVDADFNFQNVTNSVTLDLGETENLATDGQTMVVLGGSAGDVITGSAGADLVEGNGGADQIEGSGGNDTINGGNGVDTAVYDGTVTLAAADGGWTVTAGDEGTDTLSNVEVVDDGAGGKILLVGNGGYASIADAITAAESGDTIQVAAGEWTLPSGDSGKSLTFLGANAGIDANGERGPETIILGNGNFRFGGDNDTFDGFTFSGSQTFDSYVEGAEITLANNIMTNPGTTVLYVLNKPDSVTIVGNHITGVNGSDDAFFIAGDWDGTAGTLVNISGNVIEGSTAAGFNLSSVSGTIADNVIDGLSYYGFLLANDTDVDVTGNTFQNIVNPDPSVLTWGAGVRTYTPGEHFGLNLDGNEFIDNAVGLGIRSGSDIDPASIIVVNNTFTGNGNAVVNQGAATTDVTLGGSNTVDGVLLSDATESDLLAISDNVIDGVDLSGVGAVILKVGNVYLTASSFVEPLTDAPSLQRALDVAQAGDTVHVGAGTYSGIATTAVDNLTITAPADASGLAVILGVGVVSLTLDGASEIDVTGNELANVLTGNSGANVLDGQGGIDTMAGGAGNDTYVVDDAEDVVTEAASQGTDLVQSSASSYTLSANVENLTLTGDGNIDGTGNELANELTGNSGNNVLDGGADADTMAGGLGDDTYGVDDEDDVVTEAASAGTDTVQSAIDYELGDNLENLTLIGAAIVGVGNTLNNTVIGNDQDNDLDGGTGDDTLEGGEGMDTLSGGTGNDTLRGGAGEDLLLGSTGDDILDGGSGIDSMRGGTGNDTYVVDNADDSILESANQGIDTVEASIGWTLGSNLENLTLTGTDNIDGTGNSAANVLTGNSGNNVLDGLGGIDTMAGGLGDDTYVVDVTGDMVTEEASAGTDLVQSSVSYTLTANVENLTLTGDGNINGTGNELANELTGNSGNNALDGGLGADAMAGGAGDDTYVVDDAGDVVTEEAEAGTDLVRASVSYTLTANVENLTLTGEDNIDGTGNELANELTGNSGNNVLDGGAGADTMAGGLGNDTYVVTSTGDVVTEEAEAGTDLVQSSVSYTLGDNVENVTLTGSGNINATGNNVANVMIGNSGNNVLNGGAGADQMYGGLGNDIYKVTSTGDVVTEEAEAGTDVVESSVSYTLTANVENLKLTSSGNTTGTGNELANELTGNSGNNVLDGGAGADTMAGGTGNDTYVVDDAGDVVTEAASAGTDLVRASVSYTLTANVENLTLTGDGNIDGTGNSAANQLTGNSGNNVLDGGAGADAMAGGLGDDTYVVDVTGDVVTEAADEGTDTILTSVSWTLGANVENVTLTGEGNINVTGNNVANVLIGNSGNNVLNGGAGADQMYGGLGNDTYVVTSTADVVTEDASAGTDLVQSSVNYTLTANVENLTLTGSGSINGTGNELANVLTGNSGNNVLDGAAGADTMAGGTGNDTYVVDVADDVVTEAASAGTDLVRASVSYTLGANVENLTLTGEDGIDATGNSAANVLTGNSGNNVLDGQGGIDTMAGGLGDDTYVVDVTGDVVTEAADEGTDTILTSVSWTLGANVENVTLTGTGNINVTGNNVANVLIGNSGNNVLNGGAGADQMYGGLGNDTYVVTSTGDVVTEDAGAGTDLVQSSVNYTLTANVENLTLTGSGSINGTGNELANVLTGNSGNNVLDGGAGADTMAGAAGDDTYVVNTASDVVTEVANQGTDTIQSSVSWTLAANFENVTLTGDGNINATGNNAANVMIGNSGNNVLNGGVGADQMSGGGGNDTYVVTSTGDVVTEAENEGTDHVRSSISYTLTANVENLTLIETSNVNGTGNELANVLTGNAGNNVLDGGAGADTMAGGAGNDTYVVDDVGDVVTEAANQGTDLVQSSASSFTLSANVENLTLTGDGNIDGAGNGAVNILTGNAGDNVITGGGGNDTIVGGDGADTASYAQVVDTSMIATNGSGGWTVTTGGAEGTDTLSGIEKVDGAGDGQILLVGAGGYETIQEAIAASADGDTILIAEGTYTEALSISGKAITLQAVGDVVVQAPASTNAITLTGDFEGGSVSILGITVAGAASLPNQGIGVYVTEDANIGTLTLDGLEVRDAGSYGLYVEGDNESGAAPTGVAVANLVVTDSSFSHNGYNGANGSAHIKLFNFSGNALIQDVTITGSEPETAVNLRADYGIELTGTRNGALAGGAVAMGTVTLDGVTMTGWLHKNGVAIFNYADIDGLTVDGVDLSGVVTDWGPVLNIDGILGDVDASAFDIELPSGTIATELQGDKTVQEVTNQTITGTDAEDRLIGKGGDDHLIGGAGDDELYGHDKAGGGYVGDTGADILDGGTGADTMAGGLGDDTYVVDEEGDVVTEAESAGTDTVQSSIDYTLGDNLENLTLTGAATNGTGNALNNVLTGNSGDNVLDGLGGNDTMIGGLGSDTYNVDSTDDVVTEGEGAGTDLVEATASYTLSANVENLTLTGTDNIDGTGNELANELTGNSGNNVLDGQGGIDTMAGGLGDDTYVVDVTGDVVTEDEDAGTDLVRASASYTLTANVENLTLTGDGNIDGTGNELINVLTGNDGANTLDGGAGADTMAGGLGNDSYVVEDIGDLVTEEASGGTDTVHSSISYALGLNVENLTLTGDAIYGTGNDAANVIIGNLQDNELDGGSGDDILEGGDGSDTLTGGIGNDALDGGAGADLLIGGSGNDTYVVDDAGDIVSESGGPGIDGVFASINYTLGNNVENLTLTGDGNLNGTGNGLANTIAGNTGNNLVNGKSGNDTLTGGGGNDSFVFDTTLNGTTNVDQITDFGVGDDVFNLAHSVFTQISAGTLAESAFHVGASATAADQRIIYDQTSGQVMYDADGNGGGSAVQFASVTAGTLLTHDDFFII